MSGSGYYDDPTKITYDEADVLVEEYLGEKEAARSTLTSRDVADHFGVCRSTHNLQRLNDSLDRKCILLRERSPQRFRIPEEEVEDG